MKEKRKPGRRYSRGEMMLDKTRMALVVVKEMVRFWKNFKAEPKGFMEESGVGLRKRRVMVSSEKLKNWSCLLLDVEE